MIVVFPFRVGNKISFAVASIILPGAIDVVFLVIEVLNPMCNPACYSRNCKENRIHVRWESHRSVNKSRVKINVGIKFSRYAELEKLYKY